MGRGLPPRGDLPRSAEEQEYDYLKNDVKRLDLKVDNLERIIDLLLEKHEYDSKYFEKRLLKRLEKSDLF